MWLDSLDLQNCCKMQMRRKMKTISRAHADIPVPKTVTDFVPFYIWKRRFGKRPKSRCGSGGNSLVGCRLVISGVLSGPRHHQTTRIPDDQTTRRPDYHATRRSGACLVVWSPGRLVISGNLSGPRQSPDDQNTRRPDDQATSKNLQNH